MLERLHPARNPTVGLLLTSLISGQAPDLALGCKIRFIAQAHRPIVMTDNFGSRDLVKKLAFKL